MSGAAIATQPAVVRALARFEGRRLLRHPAVVALGAQRSPEHPSIRPLRVRQWSCQSFEEFAQRQIGPITQEAGVPSPPEIQYCEVHNHLTAG